MPTCALTRPGSISAHRALVYDLCWSADSRVLASCSSDGTAKAWYLDAARDHEAASRSRHAATPAGLPFCTVLHHPSFVYACQAHPHTWLSPRYAASPGGGMLVLATGCADGAVRFWGLRGDADAAAEPDGTSPLLQIAAGARLGPALPNAAVSAVLWNPPADGGATALGPGTASSTTAPLATALQTGAPDVSAPVLFTGASAPLLIWCSDAACRRAGSRCCGCGLGCRGGPGVVARPLAGPRFGCGGVQVTIAGT